MHNQKFHYWLHWCTLFVHLSLIVDIWAIFHPGSCIVVLEDSKMCKQMCTNDWQYCYNFQTDNNWLFLIRFMNLKLTLTNLLFLLLVCFHCTVYTTNDEHKYAFGFGKNKKLAPLYEPMGPSLLCSRHKCIPKNFSSKQM